MSDYPSTPSYGANYGSREQANPPYLPPSYPNQYMQQDNGRGAQGHMAQNYDTSMSAYAYNGAVPSFNSAAVASGVPPLPIFQGWHQDPVPLPPYNPQQNSTQYPPPNNNSQFVPQYYTSYNQQSYPSNVQTPKRYEQGELSEGEFEDNGHNGQATNTPPVGYGASHYPTVATNYGDSSTPTGYSAAREPSTQSYPGIHICISDHQGLCQLISSSQQSHISSTSICSIKTPAIWVLFAICYFSCWRLR